MKLMVTNPSYAAKAYLHACEVTEGVAYYENDEEAWIPGDDEHLLETLMDEVKEDLDEEDYEDIYLA